jgi:hypothetical protein
MKFIGPRLWPDICKSTNTELRSVGRSDIESWLAWLSNCQKPDRKGGPRPRTGLIKESLTRSVVVMPADQLVERCLCLRAGF